jgi:hypothetical protein
MIGRLLSRIRLNPERMPTEERLLRALLSPSPRYLLIGTAVTVLAVLGLLVL